MSHRRLHIEQVDDYEELVMDIRRHPLGLIAIYIQGVVGLVLALALSFFLLPQVMDTDLALTFATGFSAIASVFALLVLLLITYVYRQNRVVVTNRNITQTLQSSIFDRRVSQLSMGNVEDVTSEQKGVIPTILNYGSLIIETAGEQANFRFAFCPNPAYYAKLILEARERFEDGDHIYAKNSGPGSQGNEHNLPDMNDRFVAHHRSTTGAYDPNRDQNQEPPPIDQYGQE